MPSTADLCWAANTIRLIVTRTAGLPDDTPPAGALRDRLELAADVLDATTEENVSNKDQ